MFLERAKAEEITKTLNSDPEDDWTYKVKPSWPEDSGRAQIQVFDEGGVLVGTLGVDSGV